MYVKETYDDDDGDGENRTVRIVFFYHNYVWDPRQ